MSFRSAYDGGRRILFACIALDNQSTRIHYSTGRSQHGATGPVTNQARHTECAAASAAQLGVTDDERTLTQMMNA